MSEISHISAFFNQRVISPENCIHLAIDVQSMACTAAQAAHVAAIADGLRAQTIKTLWFYKDDRGLGFRHPENGLYYPDVPAGDELIEKTENSAFWMTGLHDRLQQEKKDTVIVSGYLFGVCIRATVRDSLINRFGRYNTILLTDGTNYDAARPADSDLAGFMKRNGALLAESPAIIDQFRTQRNARGPA